MVCFTPPEFAFVDAMTSGRMITALSEKNIKRRRTRTVLMKKSLVKVLGGSDCDGEADNSGHRAPLVE